MNILKCYIYFGILFYKKDFLNTYLFLNIIGRIVPTAEQIKTAIIPITVTYEEYSFSSSSCSFSSCSWS